jgi:hypothetical protein
VRSHFGVVVVRFNPLELEVDPTVLDKSLNGSGTRETDRLLLLVKGSLYIILDLLSLVSQSAGGLVGIGRESSGPGLGFTLDRVGGILSPTQGLVLVGRDGGLRG